MTAALIPDGPLAAELASAAIGDRPIEVKRFGTGAQHYVFEVHFDDQGRATEFHEWYIEKPQSPGA